MAARTVLVTGANQGLGYSVIEVGATRSPHTTWILAARDVSKGKAAAERLRSEAGVKAPIDVIQLDVTNDEHILAAKDYITNKYGKLDVLINNAGHVFNPLDDSPQALRKCYADVLDLNLTSAAVVTQTFKPLLHKASAPKVLNVTSGLGSIHNTLNTKMARIAHYGAAKVGLNGLTAHQQAIESDRIKAENDGTKPKTGDSFIKWFIINPGLLKTAFNGFVAVGRDPKEGAEAVVRVALDDKDEFEYGRSWEYMNGQMRIVPW